MKKSNPIILSICSSAISFVGGAASIFGEYDDAPGLILIGLLFFAFSVYLNIQKK